MDEKIGERAGVSRDTVRKVEKILENKRISDEVKEDLRLGKVSINEAYEKVELDRERQPLCQKMLKAIEESKKSSAEIDNQPERTKEETWKRDYFEKALEYHKACAALYFWDEYREKKNSNIESVASQTLKEIASWGIWDEMQMLPWQNIENILHHAAIENKINVEKIRDSKVIQAQLELLRREREISGEKEPDRAKYYDK